MVHITLPRGLSHLGHKNKDKDQPLNGSTFNGEHARRSSPSGLGIGSNNNSSAALVDSKPLILKVYVIKVGRIRALHEAACH
jgi:hypothetical protein